MIKMFNNEEIVDTSWLNESGSVISNKDGIIEISGLDNSFIGEVLQINNILALVMNLETENIKAVALGNDNEIVQGDIVVATGNILKVPVGENLLGRVIDCLGNPIDKGEAIMTDNFHQVEIKAPGIITRQSVHESLMTGILTIDSAIPVGRGQRELVIGDRQTGKTTICIDTIINHRELEVDDNQKLYCIYVAVGQRLNAVLTIVDQLKSLNAFNFVTVIAATAAEPIALQYLAPYVGCTMGEYFRDNQMHSLIVYDDLSKHAVAYRQISLLLRRPPGREAYPGDVFYLHSRLLERAAKLSEEFGHGSLTALPIVETLNGDVSAYIPTNIISITDGQIFLEKELFYRGIRPAINIGLSVSRVGAAAQDPLMREFVGSLKLELAQFREVEIFASFGSEIDSTTQQIIKRGSRLVELLNQDPFKPLFFEQELILLFAGRNGYLDNLSNDEVRGFKTLITDVFSDIDFKTGLENLLELDDELTRDLALDDLVLQLINKQ